jgi:hypothetical protein
VLSRARLAAALAAGKLAGSTGRLLRLGGGTSLPGIIARRIDPGVLRKVLGTTDARKIVICGSNGKTTTARMVAAIARAGGQRVTQNRSAAWSPPSPAPGGSASPRTARAPTCCKG